MNGAGARSHYTAAVTNRSLPSFAFPLALASVAAAQHGSQQSAHPDQPMYVAKASDEGREQMRSVQLADGLQIELVAAEPDLCNAVTFAIDDLGRFYVGETFRVGDGVFDNRGFMHWLDDDLAARTVQDRIAKYHKHLPAERVEDLKRYTERVRMLVDTDGDGRLDRSTVFAEDFRELEDGLVAGVEPIGDEIWTAIIPKVWRLKDTDGDGVADERTVQFDGFGVHTSLMGHDMHGLIVGPDRRVYFSIGDRGFHVEHEGKTHAYPDEGAVLRCELDGSDLEVVHRGLRNPQELAFDKWGDLITGDNNSDGGDKARLVQILPGADSGWRIGFQWLGDRGAWNREKLWHPRHAEQSALVAPPIRNFADGPSGLVYDPGMGLPERFRDCFFLCDFRGSSSYSGIRSFRLDRAGAGFEVRDHAQPIWNALATDVTFGPDGALYYLDWVHGWSKTGKARIYRVRTREMANDMKLRQLARLLAEDLGRRADTQLVQLLEHQDRRVRQKAQFALCDRAATGALAAATNPARTRLARLHGIWGLQVLLRRGPDSSRGEAAATLRGLLDDSDSDVRAMAARALGDGRHEGSRELLQQRLEDDNSRVRREAAFALARLQPNEKTADRVLKMLRHNDDRDAVLRHAGVVALAHAADDAWLERHADDERTAVQRAVMLALARRGSPAVARFLSNRDEQVRYDAARAIYETPIDGALQALAQLAYDDDADSERIDWRVIGACRALGQVEHGEALVHLATRANHPTRTRKEALEVLAEWRAPDGQCRVIGGWRPGEHPDADLVAQRFAGAGAALLADDAVAAATAKAIAGLGIDGLNDELGQVVSAADEERPVPVRLAALDALAELRAPELSAALASIADNAPVRLRKRAVELLSRSAPEQAVPVLESLLANASVSERQAACKALGELKTPSAEAALKKWGDRIGTDEVPGAIHLDLIEAMDRKHEGFADVYQRALGMDAELAKYGMCLDGGDARAGRKLFYEHVATSCTRCHTLGGTGGNAGPVLDGIGAKLTPKQLLEALVQPSARIAEGFQTTMIETRTGGFFAGVVTAENDAELTLVGADGTPQKVQKAQIATRKQNEISAMPPMAALLSRRELRDLVAFLCEQDKAADK